MESTCHVLGLLALWSKVIRKSPTINVERLIAHLNTLITKAGELQVTASAIECARDCVIVCLRRLVEYMERGDVTSMRFMNLSDAKAKSDASRTLFRHFPGFVRPCDLEATLATVDSRLVTIEALNDVIEGLASAGILGPLTLAKRVMPAAVASNHQQLLRAAACIRAAKVLALKGGVICDDTQRNLVDGDSKAMNVVTSALSRALSSGEERQVLRENAAAVALLAVFLSFFTGDIPENLKKRARQFQEALFESMMEVTKDVVSSTTAMVMAQTQDGKCYVPSTKIAAAACRRIRTRSCMRNIASTPLYQHFINPHADFATTFAAMADAVTQRGTPMPPKAFVLEVVDSAAPVLSQLAFVCSALVNFVLDKSPENPLTYARGVARLSGHMKLVKIITTPAAAATASTPNAVLFSEIDITAFNLDNIWNTLQAMYSMLSVTKDRRDHMEGMHGTRGNTIAERGLGDSVVVMDLESTLAELDSLIAAILVMKSGTCPPEVGMFPSIAGVLAHFRDHMAEVGCNPSAIDDMRALFADGKVIHSASEAIAATLRVFASAPPSDNVNRLSAIVIANVVAMITRLVVWSETVSIVARVAAFYAAYTPRVAEKTTDEIAKLVVTKEKVAILRASLEATHSVWHTVLPTFGENYLGAIYPLIAELVLSSGERRNLALRIDALAAVPTPEATAQYSAFAELFVRHVLTDFAQCVTPTYLERGCSTVSPLVVSLLRWFQAFLKNPWLVRSHPVIDNLARVLAVAFAGATIAAESPQGLGVVLADTAVAEINEALRRLLETPDSELYPGTKTPPPLFDRATGNFADDLGPESPVTRVIVDVIVDLLGGGGRPTSLLRTALAHARDCAPRAVRGIDNAHARFDRLVKIVATTTAADPGRSAEAAAAVAVDLESAMNTARDAFKELRPHAVKHMKEHVDKRGLLLENALLDYILAAMSFIDIVGVETARCLTREELAQAMHLLTKVNLVDPSTETTKRRAKEQADCPLAVSHDALSALGLQLGISDEDLLRAWVAGWDPQIVRLGDTKEEGQMGERADINADKKSEREEKATRAAEKAAKRAKKKAVAEALAAAVAAGGSAPSEVAPSPSFLPLLHTSCLDSKENAQLVVSAWLELIAICIKCAGQNPTVVLRPHLTQEFVSDLARLEELGPLYGWGTNHPRGYVRPRDPRPDIAALATPLPPPPVAQLRMCVVEDGFVRVPALTHNDIFDHPTGAVCSDDEDASFCVTDGSVSSAEESESEVDFVDTKRPQKMRRT